MKYFLHFVLQPPVGILRYLLHGEIGEERVLDGMIVNLEINM